MLKPKTIIKILAIYFLFSVVFRFIGAEQFEYKFVTSQMENPVGAITEITKDIVVKQNFLVKEETLETIDLKLATFNRPNRGILTIRLLDKNDAELVNGAIDVSTLQEGETFKWVFDTPVTNAENNLFSIELTSNSISGEGASVYYAESTNDGQTLFINGIPQEMQICFDYVGKTFFMFGTYYWHIVIGLSLIHI